MFSRGIHQVISGPLFYRRWIERFYTAHVSRHYWLAIRVIATLIIEAEVYLRLVVDGFWKVPEPKKNKLMKLFYALNRYRQNQICSQN